MQNQVIIDSVSGRIWVNGEDGSNLGRFNIRGGIDIHTSATEQLAGANECVKCSHTRPTYADWLYFVIEAKIRWGVTIPLDAIDIDRFAPQQ